MTDECRSWAALSDRLATGEALSGQERAFMAAHLDECHACSREANVWSSLGLVLEDPSVLTAPNHSPMAGPNLAGPRARWALSPVWSFLKRRRAIATVTVAALGAAAAIALVLWPRAPQQASLKAPPSLQRSVAAAPPVQSSVRVALVAGAARINRQPAMAGQYLSLGDELDVPAGEACLLLPPGVTVCVDEHSELTIARLDGGVRRLKLRTGHAVARLERQPDRASFGFETSAGSVVAHGTVFSVHAVGDDVSLRVHEGTVVRDDGRRTSRFVAPSSVSLSRDQPSEGAITAPATDARLLELVKHFTDKSTSELIITARAGGAVKLDDEYWGATPLSALIAPGRYRLAYTNGELAPVVERLNLVSGARLSRNYESSDDAASPPPGTGAESLGSGAAARRPLSATEMLVHARELRSSGQFRDAAATYRRLLREHGASAEARAALVSLGELQLSQLGDAKGALASFDAYLRGGGALIQEANYGRIRALRALGRRSEAQASVDAFLRAYPTSAQAAALRKEAP